MSDNNYDISIIREKDGWRIDVDYWHYSRKEKDRMTSRTTYTWFTRCSELIDKFQQHRTKVFYSQLRVLAKYYGKKEVEKYKFIRNLKIQ